MHTPESTISTENLATLQRAALHDLLNLARACSGGQAQAQAAFAQAEKALALREQRITQRLQLHCNRRGESLLMQAKAVWAEAQVAAQERLAQAGIKAAQAKQASIAQAKREESQLHAQLNNEVCEFSGLWEAFRNTSDKTLAEERQLLAQRRDAVQACQGRVDKRVAFVTGKLVVQPALADEAALRRPYEEAAQAMEESCAHLERVSRGAWYDNGGNWVAAILAGLVAGAAIFFPFFSMPQGVAGLSGAALGGVAGLVAAVGAGAAVLLFATSRKARRLRLFMAALEPAHMALANAQAAAEEAFRRVEQEQAQRVKEAEANHNSEVARMKSSFHPMQAKANEDAVRRLVAIETRHKQEVLAAEKHLAQAQAKHDADLARAKALQTQGEFLSARLVRGVIAHKVAMNAARAAALRLVKARWADGCARIKNMIEHLAGLDAPSMMDWANPAFAHWQPVAAPASVYRLGQLRLEGQLVGATADFHLELPSEVAVSALLPVIGNLFIEHDVTGREVAQDLLRSAVARLLLATPPGSVRLTMVDPVGLGEGFAGFMHLAESEVDLVGGRIWTAAEDIERKLGDLTDHMEDVIQKYLRNAYDTIEAYNADAGELAEPYRVLVIADFPSAFSQVAMERLLAIVQTGARCGVHVLLACDLRHGAYPEALRDALKKSGEKGGAWFQCVEGKIHWRDELYGRFPFMPDGMPDEKMLTRLLAKIATEAAKCQRVEVPFASITPSDEEVWSRSAAAGLRIPVGRSGVSRVQEFDLGRGTRQHALVAGKTGSGKSSLLNAIITNLALWYAPDEAQMFLIDFKKGIEFKTYARHNLPHAKAVAIESDLEFGLSVLRRLDGEMERRGNLFRLAGVQDLAGHRAQLAPGGEKLPRLLLVIDEFQEFFVKDDKLSQDAGALLDRIARQGRAFGIHMLLGSQTLGGGASIPRSTLGQMAVRIALQCDEADAQLILSDTNTAARLLSRPGEAIYNDAAGRVEANTPFQVAWLPDDEREQSLLRVVAKVNASGRRFGKPIVFEGGGRADVSENQDLAELLAHPPAATPNRLKLWLGSPVAIKEVTHAVFGRNAGDNLLLVGPNDEAASGVLASALLGLAAQAPQMPFTVFDGTPEDAPWADALDHALQAVQAKAQFPALRDMESVLAELHAKVRARMEGGGTQEPHLLVINGLQRYRALRKSEGGYAFSIDAQEKPPAPDKLLADIVKDGPSVGVHTVVWADTHATFDRCFERAMLREFDHRLLFQVSAADSSNLMDANDASTLGPNRALLFSEERGVKEKCLPYRVPRKDWLAQLRPNPA